MVSTNIGVGDGLRCPHCHKTFRDERGRKNHILCVHGYRSEVVGAEPSTINHKKKMKKKKNAKNGTSSLSSPLEPSSSSPLVCELCRATTKGSVNPLRIFPNARALQDHTIAKHSGRYTDIKPDWAAVNRTGTDTTVQSQNDGPCHEPPRPTTVGFGLRPIMVVETQQPTDVFGRCHVCKLPFATLESKQNHVYEFVPSFDHGMEGIRNGFLCQVCGKGFKDQRALQQHSNFCS